MVLLILTWFNIAYNRFSSHDTRFFFSFFLCQIYRCGQKDDKVKDGYALTTDNHNHDFDSVQSHLHTNTRLTYIHFFSNTKKTGVDKRTIGSEDFSADYDSVYSYTHANTRFSSKKKILKNCVDKQTMGDKVGSADY